MTSSSAGTTWGEGDYALMGDRLGEAAELVVELTEPGVGDRVLDLACGTGNAALLAAERGARTVGVDLEPVLLEVARRRDAHRAVDWRLGDVTALELADDEFSVMLSVFGIMYAADQAAAARELARCCAPGARIAITAWTPGSFMPELGRALAQYLPAQPSGSSPPPRWGDEVAVAGLLAPHGVALSDLSRHATSLEFPDPDAATGFLVRTAGHVVRERPRLEREDRWTALLADVRALVAEHDQSADGTVRLSLEYLLAVGERRGAGAAHQRPRVSFARDRATAAYYERRAGEYDDWYTGTGLFADRERPGWDEEVKRLIGLTAGLPAARTLDVACGTGFLTRHLRGLVVGIDQSPAMVAVAQSRLPDGLALIGDALRLPFADGSFQRIFTGHFYGASAE